MAEYIEREALLEITEQQGHVDVDDILGIPAVDVSPARHGRWIPEEHEDRVSPTMTHRYDWYHCSLCGRRLIGYSNPKDAPYCHCGARMDEEAEYGTTERYGD